MHQAPFTWYSQKGQLDLPPGYENGNNLRFSRKIGLECTSCHNAMPTGFVKGSINKYKKVPGAIDCERCHGPGQLHVKRMSSGQQVDTSRQTDYSIVNVKKLPADLQFEVCQRCHLQGNSVLARGKSFMDFKPGMRLNEVMDIYLPRYAHAEDDFIMASHVDRFKQSRCVVGSDHGFNCISCHNPHVSVRETKIERFNKTCGSCHKGAPSHECTENAKTLQDAAYNCVKCHMPQSTSTDIPHVTVHDHKIKVPGKVKDTTGLKQFLELVAVNNTNPGYRSKAMAYLQQFEKFEPRLFYLDSAAYFLNRMGPVNRYIPLWVHYYFLKNDLAAIKEVVAKIGREKVLSELTEKSYDNRHGWAAYRIGEALRQLGDHPGAELFLKRATVLVPFNLILGKIRQCPGRHAALRFGRKSLPGGA
ncbi:MAG: hypothetical protein U5L96_05540 [Owenweeksia sp.]|nr:hypothetical protein [Owenweeksia sp.]